MIALFAADPAVGPFAEDPAIRGMLVTVWFSCHARGDLPAPEDRGELQTRLGRVIWTCFGLFLTLFLIQTMWTLVEVPRATANFRASRWLWVVPVANVLAIANIPRSLVLGRPAAAFVSSSFNIFAYVFLLMTALWPNIIVATDPAYSLSLCRRRQQ